MKPLVSVIVPLYQSAATIGETLDSLRAQSLPDWEAIIVDDGSTDDGPLIARQHAESDPRVRVLHQLNRGLAGARNTGLRHAHGEYVYFLDADDWTEPRGLEKLVAAARSSGGAAFGAYECRDAAGGALDVTCRPSTPLVGIHELLEHNRFASHAQIIERRLLNGLTFDESLRVAEDYDLWIRLAERGVRWTAIEDTVGAYRVRPGSLSKDFVGMHETTAKVVGRAYQRRMSRSFGNAEPIAPQIVRARERKALDALAFEYWTLSVIVGRRCDEEKMRQFFGSERREVGTSAEAAANAVYWAVVLGRGLRPDLRDPIAPEWIDNASSAWELLETTERVQAGFREAATTALAATLVSPERIARGLLDRRGSERIVVVGLGRNGRAIVNCAKKLGVSLEVRDDNADALRGFVERNAVGVTSQHMSAPIGSEDLVLLSPTECTPLRSRFRTGRALTWSAVREQMALEELSLIRQLLRDPSRALAPRAA